MAVNQVSLFFYAPNWVQTSRQDSKAFTDRGEPVTIVGSARRDTKSDPLLVSDLTRFLRELGFELVDGHFERGEIESIFGPEKEIAVSVGVEGDEVKDLYCRFTLPKFVPPPVPQWVEFIVPLCERFALRLEEAGEAPCSESAFVDALTSHRNWVDFAEAYGWPDYP